MSFSTPRSPSLLLWSLAVPRLPGVHLAAEDPRLPVRRRPQAIAIALPMPEPTGPLAAIRRFLDALRGG